MAGVKILCTLAFICLTRTFLFAKSDCSEKNVIVVSNQSELDRFMNTGPPITTCIHFCLVGGSTYKVNMMKMMLWGSNKSLIMESDYKDGAAKIDCTADSSILKEPYNKTVQPLSRSSLVVLDGLIFTRCPVPILIEEASNIFIQNCVFQWVAI